MTSLDPKISIAQKEIEKRFGSPDGEMSVNLFVSHYKEELRADEWKALLGETNPTDKDILKCIVFKDSWDSEGDGNVDTYDFSLPNGLTQYVVSLRFDADTIISVDMES